MRTMLTIRIFMIATMLTMLLQAALKQTLILP